MVYEKFSGESLNGDWNNDDFIKNEIFPYIGIENLSEKERIANVINSLINLSDDAIIKKLNSPDNNGSYSSDTYNKDSYNEAKRFSEDLKALREALDNGEIRNNNEWFALVKDKLVRSEIYSAAASGEEEVRQAKKEEEDKRFTKIDDKDL